MKRKDEPANQPAKRTFSQSQEFITQFPMNLEMGNVKPQNTGIQERSSTIQNSNNCSIKPTISNQCKSTNFFHDFYFKEYGSGQYKDITAVCFTDCSVFIVSKYQRNSRLTVFNREMKRIIKWLELPIPICNIWYNQHCDSIILFIHDIEIGYRLESAPIDGFYEPCVEFTRHFREENWTPFFSFDFPKGMGIFHCPLQRQHKVFELKNYTILYTIQTEFVRCPNGHICYGFESSENSLMVVLSGEIQNEIPLKLFSKKDGRLVKQVTISPAQPKKALFILKLCGDAIILLQQDDNNMVIADISSSSCNPQIRETNVMASDEPIVVLKRKQIIVPMGTWPKEYQILDFEGKFLLKLSDTVTSAYPCLSRDLIIFSCTDIEGFYDYEEYPEANCIKAYSIISGECLGEIPWYDRKKFSDDEEEEEEELKRHAVMSNIYSIRYDEETHEIFTFAKERWGFTIWSDKILSSSPQSAA